MASLWPGGVDSFTDPTATTAMNNSTQSHSAMHSLANDAIHAMQSGAGVSDGLATLGSSTVRTVGGANKPNLSVDTAANWSANNPVLGASEFAIESDTGVVKHGNGTTAYNSLSAILSSVYAPASGSANYVPQNELVFSVKHYGATGNGTTDDSAAIQAAANAANAAGGGVVLFPSTSAHYVMSSPLPNVNNVTYRGPGGNATPLIIITAGNLLAPTAALDRVKFAQLSLQTSGGHLIELGTGAGALTHCTFEDCDLITTANASSLIHGAGTGGLVGCSFIRCRLFRPSTATVSAINITTTGGNLNSNSWLDCWFTSSGCVNGYFVVLSDNGAGSACSQNSFRNIVGENNPAGLIEVLSPWGLDVQNVIDWDQAGAYAASLLEISKSTNGNYPARIHVSNLGNRQGTLGAGVYHVAISAFASEVFLDGIGDINGARKIYTVGAVSLRDPSGSQGAVTTSTVSYSVSDTYDGTVIMNGATLTATLPDPTTVVAGRHFTVKNINASALTVVSGGAAKTIDGAASASLAQWAKATYLSDGTQWLSV